MEQFFNTYKKQIPDDGFTDRVMQRILVENKPSKAIYRGPTFVAIAASITLVLYLGLSGRYIQVSERINHLTEQTSIYIQTIVENDEGMFVRIKRIDSSNEIDGSKAHWESINVPCF